MTSPASGHPWSEESLFCKAQLYIGQMESFAADDWRFGFWSALSLELLARAALACISPVLLADNKRNWRNLTYALGGHPTAKKFSPTSLATKEVLSRLNELVPEFTGELVGFCTKHTERRNSEVHSGELAFTSLGTSEWLPGFYSACTALLKSMDRELEDLVSDPASAREMIESLKDSAAKAVQKDIKDCEKVWLNKNGKEQEKASMQAMVWAAQHAGHNVVCPACNSNALLQGTPSGEVKTEMHGLDELVQRQTLLPSLFECIACGLRISGLSKLSACGLGDAFVERSVYTPADFFDLGPEDEYEEFFNE